MNKLVLILILMFFISACSKEDEIVIEPLPDSLDEEVDYLADQYVKVGAVVGIIDKSQKKHVFQYGSRSIINAEPPDANTVFDIGSVTKTFTAVLTAKMYQDYDYSDEIVGHYLPADKVTLPSKDNVEITFLNLLTHTSGLPRSLHMEGTNYPVPVDFDPENPYSVYSTGDVYKYLTNYCVLEFTPGTYWGYSNTGFGLLGHTLGIIDGSSYEDLLTREIFNVLGMQNSSLFLTDEQLKNVAPGHDKSFKMVSFYTANDIFQGCGMIKSCLNDLFRYLECNMGIMESPLNEAMLMTHMNSGVNTGSMGYQALAWFILKLEDGQEIIYSGGDTNGHSAYLAFNKSNLTGAIILLNASFHDGTNLNFGHKLMMAIDKY